MANTAALPLLSTAELRSRGCLIVRLDAATQYDVPGGWAIRDIVTGLFRGHDALEPRVASRLDREFAWTRYRLSALRKEMERQARSEASRLYADAEPMSDYHVRYWMNLKAPEPFPGIDPTDPMAAEAAPVPSFSGESDASDTTDSAEPDEPLRGTSRPGRRPCASLR
ncbi:MAG TPA: hypothetical protein VM031_04005 [Phycisphaerae bacterium]|nr:hypothetical protein [Phycisphaerae bacterium]